MNNLQDESDLGKLSKSQIIELYSQLKKKKAFGLIWEDKPEDLAELCKSKLPFLKSEKSLDLIKKKDEDFNFLIEGDNYHSLSVLNYTHKEQFDIIYIDPPYNTGAKDWKYNNSFVDENDSFRHSKWLSFISKRLRLAKPLLKPTGSLICTIDKNEVFSLGLLLEDIFPEREIVCVTIVHNPGGIQGLNFSHTNEYAFFVYPDKKHTYISKVVRDDAPDTAFRDWGKDTSLRIASKNCFYPILVKNNKIIGFGDVCPTGFHPKTANIKKKNGIIEVYPVDSSGIERKWRVSKQSVDEVKHELFCDDVKGEIQIKRAKTEYRWKTVWLDDRYNANVYGTKLLNQIIATPFPFPKSLYAVQDCIKAIIHDKNNALILDFFAGSGTTGHAVLDLNNQDGGKRRFVLCTNNENGIARDVCFKRLKNVINGYKGRYDNKDRLPLNGNLKYFITDFVDSEPTDKNKRLLTNKATEMLCLKENTFEKIFESPSFKIFNNKTKVTGILYDNSKIASFKKELLKHNGDFSIYIFSLGDDDFIDDFKDFGKKHKVNPIPEVILRVYRRLFKP